MAGDGDVPNRPAAQRMEPPPPAGDRMGGGGGAGGGMDWGHNGNVQFTFGYGFFPSLFGLQFQTVGPEARVRTGAPQSREEQQQLLVARVLFALGCAMVLMLMLI